jgi:hypothetical protein
MEETKAPLSEEELDEVYGGAAIIIEPCSSVDCCVEPR